MSDPKLLHELDWHGNSAAAPTANYVIHKHSDDGTYDILSRRWGGPRWYRLQPIAAQAVLYYVEARSRGGKRQPFLFCGPRSKPSQEGA
jgi:hypothetical protein